MIMKLRNKKTGEVMKLDVAGETKHLITLRKPEGGLVCSYTGLTDITDRWDIIDE